MKRIIVDIPALKRTMRETGGAILISLNEMDKIIDAHVIELPDVVRRDDVGEILCAQEFARNRDGLDIAAKIGKLPAWTGKEQGDAD